MASYLALLAIGDFRITQSEHKGKPLLTAVAADLPSGDIDAALARTPQIADFLQQYLGPYPFDAYGGVVVDSDEFGPMETQTRPIYPSSLWEETSDTSIVAHEMAHQWFGNSVAVDSWQHIWLNEGLPASAPSGKGANIDSLSVFPACGWTRGFVLPTRQVPDSAIGWAGQGSAEPIAERRRRRP